jgi:hypothetical protein
MLGVGVALAMVADLTGELVEAGAGDCAKTLVPDAAQTIISTGKEKRDIVSEPDFIRMCL